MSVLPNPNSLDWTSWSLYDPKIHIPGTVQGEQIILGTRAEDPALPLSGAWASKVTIAKKELKPDAAPLSPGADGDTIILRYQGRIIGPEMKITDTPPEPFDSSLCPISANAGQLVPALEVACSTAVPGDRFIVWSTPEFAYGPLGCPPRIPPKSNIMWEVTVEDIQRKVTIKGLGEVEGFQARLEEARKSKAVGTEKFKAKAYAQAIKKYNYALDFLKTKTVPGSEAEMAELSAEKASLLLNIAACHLKKKEYSLAASRCDDVLKIVADPECYITGTDIAIGLQTKAFYRIAQAMYGDGEMALAKRNALIAANLSPQAPEIRTLLADIEKKAEELRKNNPFNGIFCKPKQPRVL